MTSALARLGTIKAAAKRPAKAKPPSAPLLAAAWPIVDVVRIALPLPPSGNGLYANVRGLGRMKTRAYRQWINDAAWIVKTANVGRVVGSYTFDIHLPAAMRGDVDGRTKAALDLFVRLGATDDDRNCLRAVAEKLTEIPKGECLVIIKSAGVQS